MTSDKVEERLVPGRRAFVAGVPERTSTSALHVCPFCPRADGGVFPGHGQARGNAEIRVVDAAGVRYAARQPGVYIDCETCGTGYPR
jgi:hypothetical protein